MSGLTTKEGKMDAKENPKQGGGINQTSEMLIEQ
jgi:hypothetical protein